MVPLPLHPRLARIVAGAPLTPACVVAAIVDERDVLRSRTDALPTDLALRVAIVCGHTSDDRADRAAVRRVRDRAADIARRVGCRFDLDSVDPDRTGLLLLAGFPDRLAGRRRHGQFQLRTGAGAWVADDDPLASAPFLVAADLDGKRSRSADPSRSRGRGVRDRRRARRRHRARPPGVGRRSRRPRGSCRATARRAPSRRGGAAPGTGSRNDGGTRRPGARIELARARLDAGRRAGRAPASACCGATLGDEWPDLSDGELLRTLDDWLAPHLADATSIRDVTGLDLATILRRRLPWPLARRLDELAPPSWTLPNGRRGADRLRRRPTDRGGAGAGRVRRPGRTRAWRAGGCR